MKRDFWSWAAMVGFFLTTVFAAVVVHDYRDLGHKYEKLADEYIALHHEHTKLQVKHLAESRNP